MISMNKAPKRAQSKADLQAVWKGLIPALAWAGLLLTGCSMRGVDLPAAKGVSTEAAPLRQGKENRPNGPSLRGWVHSVRLQPARVDNSGVLTASADWGPAGQPRLQLRYRWVVNGKLISNGADGRLPLDKFRPGDRIHAVAQVVQGGKRIVAEMPSRSTIVQNRPPRLDAGLTGLRPVGDALVGAISASDPDGDPFSIRLLEGPEGLHVDPDGAVRWPLSQVTLGRHRLALALEDIRGLGLRETILFSMESTEG